MSRCILKVLEDEHWKIKQTQNVDLTPSVLYSFIVTVTVFAHNDEYNSRYTILSILCYNLTHYFPYL